MKRSATIFALFAVAFLLASFALGQTPAPTYTAPVKVTVLFSNGTPMQGTIRLTDLATAKVIKTWPLTVESGGSASDTVVLNLNDAYTFDLIGLSEITRQTVTLYPALLPNVKSASITVTLYTTFRPDGKTYVLKHLQSDLEFQ